MSRVFTKTSTRVSGKDRTGTVHVEAVKGRVLVTSQDEGGPSYLFRHSSDDPQRDAGRMARDLLDAGYRES